MMNRFLGVLTPIAVAIAVVAIFGLAESHILPEATAQTRSQTQQDSGGDLMKKFGIGKDKDKDDELKEGAEAKQDAHSAVIKRMMRIVHRGKQSPMVVIQSAVKDHAEFLEKKPNWVTANPNWEQLKPLAEWVEVMGIALDEEPIEKGKTYLEMAKELKKSISKKDFGKLKESVKVWEGSCARCHGWSPPS